ncbi:uncharacterized protein Cipc isoform X1 [Halyomorpha halys]|uniref:uncharacterized protein Cipc isoform X1 n=1 Tax=Halyomorpha halys TaxID=286706 RepID=UPI0034D1C988
MAPTVSDIGDYRDSFSLEDQLQRILRLSPHNEGVRHKRSPHKPFRLTSSKVCTLMGLVVDQGVREGDSPGLPSSNTSIDIDRRSHDMSRKQDLIDITLKTMVLLRRNQILQKRLNALQMETRAFVKSALNNQQNGIDK